MKRNGMLLMALFLMLSATSVFAGDLKDKFKGTWEVFIPNTDEEYQKFTVEIKVNGDDLVYDLKGKDTDLKNQKFVQKNGKLTTQVYVGASFKVTLWEEKGKIRGTVENSAVILDCFLKRLQK